MIKSFKSREAEKIFGGEYSTKLPTGIQRVVMRKLWMVDSALNVGDLRIPPANRLELLQGDRKGQYSVRVNDQWRICFKWRQGDAYDVEVIDYHK